METIAIIGASGSCGRQLCAQLLVLLPGSKLQLVGRRGGKSAHALPGLVCDLTDAFEERSPEMEIVLDPEDIDADLVIMMAGATLRSQVTSKDVDTNRDRLGKANLGIFTTYANALAKQKSGRKPIVIVQSNPVELGVQIFAEKLGRKRVLGAGALSDSLRFRSEIARRLGINRNKIMAPVLGQHGDYLVPIYSQIRVRGAPDGMQEVIDNIKDAGSNLMEYPDKIRQGKARVIELIAEGRTQEAYDFVNDLRPELGAAVRPLFTHFTCHSTEMATAHSVAEFVQAFLDGSYRAVPAQVVLEGEWLDIHGVVAAPVVLGPNGWLSVLPLEMNDNEIDAVKAAAKSIQKANEVYV